MLVKKVDGLFQRVCYLSPLKGTGGLTLEQATNISIGEACVQASGAGCQHEEAVLGGGTFAPCVCFCRPIDGFQFIFLSLLFVALRHLTSVLLLSDC